MYIKSTPLLITSRCCSSDILKKSKIFNILFIFFYYSYDKSTKLNYAFSICESSTSTLVSCPNKSTSKLTLPDGISTESTVPNIP